MSKDLKKLDRTIKQLRRLQVDLEDLSDKPVIRADLDYQAKRLGRIIDYLAQIAIHGGGTGRD